MPGGTPTGSSLRGDAAAPNGWRASARPTTRRLHTDGSAIAPDGGRMLGWMVGSQSPPCLTAWSRVRTRDHMITVHRLRPRQRTSACECMYE
eukprot:scaffold1827_cov421-Prasinococcus_capsulatus_cf.AAC.32